MLKRTTSRRDLLGAGVAGFAAFLVACKSKRSAAPTAPPTIAQATLPVETPAAETPAAGTAAAGTAPTATPEAATAAAGIAPTGAAAANATPVASRTPLQVRAPTTTATGSATPGAARASAGAVYALTNGDAAAPSPANNAVAVFNRAADGRLTMTALIPTGGRGVGEQDDGEALGSQHALVLSQDNRWLYAVNGGSGDISVFAVQENGLQLVQQVPSQGPRPISLSQHGNVLYVLNYSRQNPVNGNITAFRAGNDGRLSPVPNSTRPLSSMGAVDPGIVQFSPAGKLLAVTEKATNKLLTYMVDSDGLAGQPKAFASNGKFPFSLAFVSDTVLVVADNFNDAPLKSAASAYGVDDKGALKPIGNAVPTKQTGACWIATTSDGKFAYTVNTGSNSLSGYSIDATGRVALLTANNPTAAGDKPRDIVLADGGRFLYVLNSRRGTVGAYAVQPDGSLKYLSDAGSFPAPGAMGLAAR